VGLGGAAAWPLTAQAQQGERVRRIGVLLPTAADDPEYQAHYGAFLQALALLGWTIGRNVQIDTRWATANTTEVRRQAAELAALAPDIILTSLKFGNVRFRFFECAFVRRRPAYLKTRRYET
jgi:putative ABC transport system substrate-binding protein